MTRLSDTQRVIVSTAASTTHTRVTARDKGLSGRTSYLVRECCRKKRSISRDASGPLGSV